MCLVENALKRIEKVEKKLKDQEIVLDDDSSEDDSCEDEYQGSDSETDEGSNDEESENEESEDDSIKYIFKTLSEAHTSLCEALNKYLEKL